MAELRVFLDVPDQLLLDEIDEKVDFLLAITTLTYTRPGERDIMNIGWGESHVLLPSLVRRRNVKNRGRCGQDNAFVAMASWFAFEQLPSASRRTGVALRRPGADARASPGSGSIAALDNAGRCWLAGRGTSPGGRFGARLTSRDEYSPIDGFQSPGITLERRSADLGSWVFWCISRRPRPAKSRMSAPRHLLLMNSIRYLRE
jgi:hypothetical protein